MLVLENEQIDCHYCAEKIMVKAKKCKHCGEILDPQMRELDMLKKQQNVPIIVNNNNNANLMTKRNYPWFWHLILSLLTGFWFFIWLICYITRDKNIYN